MKKYLVLLAMATWLTACSGSSDTVPGADTGIAHAADSLKASLDSTAVKVDSTIKAAADTVEVKINQVVDSAKKAIKK